MMVHERPLKGSLILEDLSSIVMMGGRSPLLDLNLINPERFMAIEVRNSATDGTHGGNEIHTLIYELDESKGPYLEP